MKVNARQRAHRKCRRDSGIVGQATTDDPIDTRVRACYAKSTLVLVGRAGGTASVRLLRLSRCRVLFSAVVAGALQRPVVASLGQRHPTGCGSRESEDSPLPQHCCCDKYNTQGTESGSPSPARSNVLRLSLAAGIALFYTAINSRSS
jgi:hypothetical protein